MSRPDVVDVNDSQSKTAGSEVEREAFLDHWTRDVPEECRAITRIRAEKDLLLGIGRGPLREAADAWQARATLSHPATQAGALQAVELSDDKVREGFRAYDWQISGARHQTPWQLWRDGAFWAIRAVNSGALAAIQPNAAPAAEVVALTITREGGEPIRVTSIRALPHGFMAIGERGMPYKFKGERADIRLALAAPGAAIDAREREALDQISSLLTSMFVSARAHVQGDDEIVVGYTVRNGALHKIVGILASFKPVIIPSNMPKAHETITGILTGTSASRSEAPEARPNAAGQEQGWMPIATAPKDEILLLAAEFDRPSDWRIKCGYYSVEMGAWRVWGASWKPTMWQPMPAPPLEAVGSSGMTADKERA